MVSIPGQGSSVYEAAAAAAKSLQSCLTLYDPIDSSPPGSPFPGILQARTLEWVAISFSNAWKWKVKVKSLSRFQLFATPWTAAYQAPPSMGFSRQEYWSGVPLPSLVYEAVYPKTKPTKSKIGKNGTVSNSKSLVCQIMQSVEGNSNLWIGRKHLQIIYRIRSYHPECIKDFTSQQQKNHIIWFKNRQRTWRDIFSKGDV